MKTDGGRNLILAGFMGTGKTTVGRLVAERLAMRFVDTDAEIERRAGRFIAEIFAGEGEAAFRQLEAAVCREVAGRGNQVIATGGGALLDPATYAALTSSGLLVGLICELDQVAARLGGDGSRPLYAGDRDRLAWLFDQRAALYAGLPHRIDTTHLTPSQVADEVIRLWQNQPKP